MGARLSGAARRHDDPAPPITLEQAKAQILAMLDRPTGPILTAYPAGEPLSWPAKEAEATAFMAAAEPVAADYALLRAEVAAEHAIGQSEVTLPQLTAKAEAVLWMASQWRALIATTSGLRKRGLTAIAAASDDAGRRAVLAQIEAEVAGLMAA